MSKRKQANPLGKDLPLLRRARALWLGGKTDEALACFSRAVQQNPRSVRALLDAARAFGNRFEIPRAERYLDRASLIAGKSPVIARLIAQSYRMIHRSEKAIACFENLRRGKGGQEPDLLFELAVLYERSNRIDQAHDAICQCLEKDPDYPEPKLVLARLERRRGNGETAEGILRELAAKTGGTGGTAQLRARVFAEIAETLDCAGDYEGAFSAIGECKAILKGTQEARRLAKTSLINNEILRRIYADVDRQLLRDWRELALPADDRCRGIGHLLGFPRTGTTLLEQILDAHSDLVSSQERVVFSRDIFMDMYRSAGQPQLTLDTLKGIPRDALTTHRSHYLDYMEAALGEPLDGRFHIDKNPNHTSLIIALYRLFPESKFLFSIRDPRDVIVSCYMHFFNMTEFSVNFLTLEGACQIYAFDMGLWQHIKPMMDGNWLELRYEDTIADLEGQARRALEFLGLPWDPAVLRYRELLETKNVNSPTHEAVRQPIHANAIGRWKNYQKFLEPQLEKLQPLVETFGYA